MTPEQTQRLRELAVSARRGEWHDHSFLLNTLLELLDDWERMRKEIDVLDVALKDFLRMTDRLDDWLKAVAASPVVHEHHKGKYVEVQIDGPTWEGIQEFRKWHGPDTTRTLNDGFGNVWAKCVRADCGLQIVRPGKVQCSRCEEEEHYG